MRDLPDDDNWLPDRRRVIGERVREARRLQSLTQDAVWLAARIDRRTLQRLEAGEEVTLGTLLRVAWVLDIPLATLVR